MTHNTTSSLDKLTCTDVDFGKCQDRFGRQSWSEKDSNYLDVKPKALEKDDKRVRFLPNYTNEESADSCSRKLWQRPIQITTMSTDMEEQLNLVRIVVDVTDWPNRKNCVCSIKWMRQRAPVPKSNYLEETWRRRKITKVSM